MKKAKVAVDQWFKQKTPFYIYDLKVTRKDLREVEVSTEKCDKEIQKIVAIAEPTPDQISGAEFSSKIKLLLERHEAETLSILGPKRLDKAKTFRDDFNKTVWERFGTRLKFTGF